MYPTSKQAISTLDASTRRLETPNLMVEMIVYTIHTLNLISDYENHCSVLTHVRGAVMYPACLVPIV